jgi:hypothetical protein
VLTVYVALGCKSDLGAMLWVRDESIKWSMDVRNPVLRVLTRRSWAQTNSPQPQLADTSKAGLNVSALEARHHPMRRSFRDRAFMRILIATMHTRPSAESHSLEVSKSTPMTYGCCICEVTIARGD